MTRTPNRRESILCWLAAGVLLWGGVAEDAGGEQPLHVWIDELIERAAGDAVPLRPATDYEFLRRVYLDLAGRIPAVDEVRQFDEDSQPGRRERLIDRLLESADFPRRMAEQLDVMLMERRGGHEQWRQFLHTAMVDQLGWNVLVRHVVDPPADDPRRRGAATFIVKRLERYGQNPSDMPGLVRDVGRLFLGMDLQCAQCHDHLFVDDYKQRHYQGLFAFLGQSEIRRDMPFPAVSQKLMTQKLEFASVFDPQPMATGPRLPGREEVGIPTFAKGEEYEQPPDRKTRQPGVPKFQPLAELARQITAEDNDAFARNFANRMWWMMMGRGLVDPLDLSHSDNPPSHPELLDLLAQQSRTHDFDIRWLLGQLARMCTYQRSGRLPPDASPQDATPESYRVALERPLSAEQLCRSLVVAAGLPQAVLPPCESDDEQLWPLDAERLEAFRKAFANPPKEPEIDYRPSVKAALFLMNSEQVLELLQPEAGGALLQLAQLEDVEAIADGVYLQVFSRHPDAGERAEAAAFVRQEPNRTKAVGQLAWALLASTEFLVNH